MGLSPNSPMRTIEGIAVIDHQSDESLGERRQLVRCRARIIQPFPHPLANKDGLPRVRIGSPLIEREHPQEVPQVMDLSKQGVGK